MLVSGAGLTINHTETGSYTVTCITPWTSAAAVTVTVTALSNGSGLGASALSLGPTESSTRVIHTFIPGLSTPVDNGFCLIAVGSVP